MCGDYWMTPDRCSPYRRHWDALEELQVHTDARRLETMRRRVCPATGTDVFSAWERERAHLGPLPEPMPEPFDIAVTRRVGADCTVAFEARTYSVPFVADRPNGATHVRVYGATHGC